jgi:hypothetical protein
MVHGGNIGDKGRAAKFFQCRIRGALGDLADCRLKAGQRCSRTILAEDREPYGALQLVGCKSVEIGTGGQAWSYALDTCRDPDGDRQGRLPSGKVIASDPVGDGLKKRRPPAPQFR